MARVTMRSATMPDEIGSFLPRHGAGAIRPPRHRVWRTFGCWLAAVYF
ncbi:hypothetical protein X726_32195 [Mesorhizobium sp. L103C105A0]|nr:hypothetical protein X726_32195 [Mesorhizobium sp. L103C105A0]